MSDLTRAHVEMAYRLILGREPESEQIVDLQLAGNSSVADLRRLFLSSAEFKSSVANYLGDVERRYWSRNGDVEVLVEAETLRLLAERIRRQWFALGEAEPYWSVLTDEKFKLAALDEASVAGFHESGRQAADLIDLMAAKSGVPVPRGGVCLELGCGVGRITRHLAERFDRVIAVDISPGNLRLCEHYMQAENVGNVETRLISAIGDLADLPELDFFYSVIVLQHNPPPVQFEMLRLVLPLIRNGGGCLFQTGADLLGYRFDSSTYLASAEPEMEIHSLPMPFVLKALRDADLIVDTVEMDAWIGQFGSYTFAAHKH